MNKQNFLAHKHAMVVAISLLGWWFATSSVCGQFSVDWLKVAGGGGTSTGGVYAMSGTIGQPDAGVAGGGQYSLAGGFWSVVSAIQTPGAPLLSVLQTNGVVTISWPKPAENWLL